MGVWYKTVVFALGCLFPRLILPAWTEAVHQTRARLWLILCAKVIASFLVETASQFRVNLVTTWNSDLLKYNVGGKEVRVVFLH